MIARRLRMNTPSKSSMYRLVSYLTDDQGVDSRVGEIRISNCASEEPELAALEMLAVQQSNHRAQGDKTYHLVLSFQEYPSSAALKDMEERVCKELGFAGHQRVSVMHGDTDHPHLHIAINKIHPERLTMREPYYDKQKLATFCARMERLHGLRPDNHIPRAQAAETASANMENAGDLESLTGFIRRNCLEGLKSAASWKEAHELLAKHGLSIRPRANGLVISSGDVHVKASSVDRSLSRKRLEERLGEFAPQAARANKVEPVRRYQKKPLQRGYDSSGLWSQYKQAMQQGKADRRQAVSDARKARDAEIAELKATSDARLVLIRHMGIDPAFKRFLAMLNRRRLRRKAAKARQEFARQRGLALQQHAYLPWDAWLRAEAGKGNAGALAYLEARKDCGTVQGEIFGPARDEARPTPQKTTRHGTFLYAEGRERKRRILVDPQASDDEMEKSLRLALERFGSRLFVSGPPGFGVRLARCAAERKVPVAFFDRELERCREAAVRGEQYSARWARGR